MHLIVFLLWIVILILDENLSGGFRWLLFSVEDFFFPKGIKRGID